ncbi:MAG: ring-cleaving dioxygenase [Candidatus Dormibacteraeota bacterium]|nr:ring-cleaving dioxygenase [Candidatus Dormibacteraeota bacterium]
MTLTTQGLHHVTAIGGDPQRNLEFYIRTLGLRLVKRTVNFDDPGTYHFYFGDELGRPGTLLTFFPWADAPTGRRGTGQVTTTTFSVPAGSLDWWQARLRREGREANLASSGESATLVFEDPDGLQLALAEAPGDPRPAWTQGTLGADQAIRGLNSVTLTVSDARPTVEMLGVLGMTQVGEGPRGLRFAAAGNGPGSLVDLVEAPGAQRGVVASGTVHHVAWRTPDDATQAEWLERLRELDVPVTPVRDRQYFHSIYFREPGGVLFEIATDQPGFATDETPAELGTALKLPAWLETGRAQIEGAVTPIQLPAENNPQLNPTEFPKLRSAGAPGETAR